MTKCVAYLVFVSFCAAQLPIPLPKFDPTKSVNEELICYDLPLLDNVCFGYKLEACDKGAVSFNMTYGDEVIIKQQNISLADASGQKICTSDFKDQIPNYDTLFKGCDVCLKIKNNPPPIFTGGFAKFCPDMTIQCNIKIPGLPKPISGAAQQIDLQCIEIGNACEATSCMACNKYSMCGWCAGALHPITKKPGLCMNLVGSSPLCETCDSGWTPEYQTCPGASRTSGGKTGDGDSDSTADGEGSSGMTTATTVAVILGVVILGLLGIICYKRANAKGTLLSHHDQFKGTAQPIDLEIDENDAVDLHVGSGIPGFSHVSTSEC